MKAAAFVVCLLGGCAFRPPSSPPAATTAPELLFDAVADVASMARDTNEARFEALTGLLGKRRIPFTVEPFVVEPRKTEPRTTGRNIVVTIPGTEPEIVVGAHYDAARLRDGTLSQGAVDNAASAVILVHLAEALPRLRLRRQVRVVFFDMEELGLLGSAQFVSAHKGRSTLAMVNLDVNAFGNTVIAGPRNPANEAARAALQTVCAEMRQRCLDFATMPPGDDLSFAKAAIPALSIATLPELQAHQLWLTMNGGATSGLSEGFAPAIMQTIHTAEDRVALADPAAMTVAYRTTLALMAKLGR